MPPSKKELKGAVKYGADPKTGIKYGASPKTGVHFGADPDSIFQHNPSWRFSICDIDQDSRWAFTESRLSTEFWQHIFPRLRALESMTWADILIVGKKANHAINPEDLNKGARDRLDALQIETEAVISLRVNGVCRLYGILEGPVYKILWYDNDHGDNLTCVCRSHKKHT